MGELRRRQIASALVSEGKEFRQSYAESFLGTRLALQIRSNRKARRWTQKKLAAKAGLFQSQISPLEDIENTVWSFGTLQKVAAAMDLVLVVKLESFGEAVSDFASVSPEELARPSFKDDSLLKGYVVPADDHHEILFQAKWITELREVPEDTTKTFYVSTTTHQPLGPLTGRTGYQESGLVGG